MILSIRVNSNSALLYKVFHFHLSNKIAEFSTQYFYISTLQSIMALPNPD